MYNKPPVLAGSYGRSASPAPSTGSAASSRHRRTDAPAADHGDYFDGPPRLGKNGSYRSLPGTPREGLRRNISFSPRIQFHDVWSPSDYDRRGDVATCNRLTPMLAQQIKEELNTFKMVSHGRQDQKSPMLTPSRRWKSTSCPRCTRTSSNVLILHDLAVWRQYYRGYGSIRDGIYEGKGFSWLERLYLFEKRNEQSIGDGMLGLQGNMLEMPDSKRDDGQP